MIQLDFLGGPAGSSAGAVGAFQYLGELNQKMRQVLEQIASNSEDGLLRRATAAGTLMMRDIMAYQYSPYYTGTLSSAHRAEIEVYGDEARGTIYIDPGVVNPITHGRPSVYGIAIRDDYEDWPSNAVLGSGDAVLAVMAEHLVGGITEIFAT